MLRDIIEDVGAVLALTAFLSTIAIWAIILSGG